MKWWFYILIYIVSQLTGGLVAFVLSAFFHVDPVLVMIVTLFLANVLAICFVLLFKPAWLPASADKKQMTLLALLMALPVIVLVNIAMEILPELPNILNDTQFDQVIKNPLGILIIAVIAPVSEELLFRAGVLGSLLKRDAERCATGGDRQPWLAIIWSALLFSLAHLNPAQMPVALILGLLLGWAYWRTGSLVAPCLIHILNNSFAVGLSLAYNNPDITLSQVLGGEVGVAIAVGVSVIWLGICLHKVARV